MTRGLADPAGPRTQSGGRRCLQPRSLARVGQAALWPKGRRGPAWDERTDLYRTGRLGPLWHHRPVFWWEVGPWNTWALDAKT